MPAVLTFVGLEELKAELRKMPQALDAEGGAIVRAAAAQAEAAILAVYPKGATGNLREGVSVSEVASGTRLGVKMIVRSAAAHAHWIEYGTASRAYHGANRGAMPGLPGGPVFIPAMKRARVGMWAGLRRLLEANGIEVSD